MASTKNGNEVNHPSHYNQGKIEVIEFIEDQGLTFHRGNAVKYISRAGKKSSCSEITDIRKAIWYLKRDLEIMEAAEQKRQVVRPNDMNPRMEKMDKIEPDSELRKQKESLPGTFNGH